MPENHDHVAVDLYEAAKRPRTPEEVKEQRISFAVGMVSKKSKMPREEIEKIAKEAYG